MRALFVTSDATHLHAMVPTAWALRAAGHEVRVAGPPALVETITWTGLTAVPSAAGDSALGAHVSAAGQLAAQPGLDALVEFACRWRPDLVVWNGYALAGSVAARASGAASIRMLAGPDHWARTRGSFLSMEQHPGAVGDDPLAAFLGAALARFGCGFDEEAIVGQATLDPLPAWLRFPLDINYWSVRPVPYSGPAVVPARLSRRPRRPRVCLTLDRAAAVPIGELLEAMSALDVEVVAAVDPARIPPTAAIPDNVRLFDDLPPHTLLPTCSAVVHDAGADVVGPALLHGVPHLVLVDSEASGRTEPFRRLAARGAGLLAEAGRLDADALTAQLDLLLTEPSFAARAAAIRQEMLAIPSPRDLVEELVAFAHGQGVA